MTIKNWRNFTNLGYVMTSYTFLRALETIQAVTLCHIISEYNYAQNSGLNLAEFFLTSPARMANYLGFDEESLFKTLNELQDLGFISFHEINVKNAVLICVNEEEIFDFKENTEDENLYGNWDTGLFNVQNPINKLNLQASTKTLKDFIDTYFKKKDYLPAVILLACDYIICRYEANGIEFWNIPEIEEKLIEILDDKVFTPSDIYCFVKDVCEK